MDRDGENFVRYTRVNLDERNIQGIFYEKFEIYIKYENVVTERERR